MENYYHEYTTKPIGKNCCLRELVSTKQVWVCCVWDWSSARAAELPGCKAVLSFHCWAN